MKIFLYSSSVYSCHLFLISYASFRSIQFLSFIVLIFAWNFSVVSQIFLKSYLVFPILLFSLIFCFDCWGRLSISSYYFLELCNKMSISFFFSFPFCIFSFFQLLVRPPQATILPFSISFAWGILIPASYTLSWPSIHSFYSTLSIRSKNPLNLFVTSTV